MVIGSFAAILLTFIPQTHCCILFVTFAPSEARENDFFRVFAAMLSDYMYRRSSTTFTVSNFIPFPVGVSKLSNGINSSLYSESKAPTR